MKLVLHVFSPLTHVNLHFSKACFQFFYAYTYCTIASFPTQDHESKALVLIISLPFHLHSPFLIGGDGQSFGGRVISVKWGDYTRRIGIDGTAEAIKEAIKSAFRLRTKRAFWLEDEVQIIRSLDRDMPLGNYLLHVDEGMLICL